jgi:drug/metabolite transporter (DMT)-like permease
VTYLMLVVALLWGVIDGEVFGLNQGVASLVIVLGVYLVNKRT